MAMLNTVLVAVDFSKQSEQALREASDLCRHGAKLYVVHVAEPLHQGLREYMGDETRAGMERLQQRMDEFQRIDEERLGHLKERLQEFAARHMDEGVNYEVVLRTGRPSDTIVQTARELEADMIVIGTRGRTGLAHMLGSVAERVVQHAGCSVLVTRA